tara:strand:- start:781 stop:1080 length:300 start_codon:yes stop_codon:yes gene_type:complete
MPVPYSTIDRLFEVSMSLCASQAMITELQRELDESRKDRDRFTQELINQNAYAKDLRTRLDAAKRDARNSKKETEILRVKLNDQETRTSELLSQIQTHG